MDFLKTITQEMAQFSAYLTYKATIESPYFTKPTQTVEEFLAEIKQIAELLEAQHYSQYAEIYAEKLLKQWYALHKAVVEIKRLDQAKFKSNITFPANIHALPPRKRLHEYQKVLRALNEKLSWLFEKRYNADEDNLAQWENQIAETEYRKQKCLKAIEQLEEKVVQARY